MHKQIHPNILSFISNIMRDPLVHFLLIGLCLYALISAFDTRNDINTIVIDDKTLMRHMQFQSGAFNADTAQTAFNNLTEDARKDLINTYIKEEALYREAKQMGFEDSDYIIRQRMVQKFDFLAESAMSSLQFTRSDLKVYYDKNLQNYLVPAKVSLTHIYFGNNDSEINSTNERALSALENLNTHTQERTAEQYGDRFPYQYVYSNRSYSQVFEIFGQAFADLAFSKDTPLQQWIGPISSSFGSHLIFITGSTSEHTESFEDIINIIEHDLTAQTLRKRRAIFLDEIVEKYAVQLNLSANVKPLQSTDHKK